MQIRRIVSVLILFLALPLFGRENTDVIFMQNGDRMTGQVKGLDAGVLYVSLPYVIQTFSVDWTKVARIESKQLFIVKTEDGTVYRGVLTTAESAKDRPVKIEVLEAPDKQFWIEQTQIVQIAETSDKFWQRFNGAVNLGIAYTKGNETVQYTLGSQTEYRICLPR